MKSKEEQEPLAEQNKETQFKKKKRKGERQDCGKRLNKKLLVFFRGLF